MEGAADVVAFDLATDAEIGAEVGTVRVGHADLTVFATEDDHTAAEVRDGGRLADLDLGRERDDEPSTGITMRLGLREQMAHRCGSYGYEGAGTCAET